MGSSAKVNAKASLQGVAKSGALRAQIDTKVPTHLVPFSLIAHAAVGLNYGAAKYAARNFELGFSLSTLLNSIDRHTRAMMNGEYLDSDSGLPHLVLLASSVAMLCENVSSDTVEYDIEQRPQGAIDARKQVDYLSEGLMRIQQNSQDTHGHVWERRPRDE